MFKEMRDKMRIKSEGLYTVSEKTRKQTNLYHLKKIFRALNSKEWYTEEEVFDAIFNRQRCKI